MNFLEKLWYYCPKPMRRRAGYILRLGGPVRFSALAKGEYDLGYLRTLGKILLAVLAVLLVDAIVVCFGRSLLGNLFLFFRTDMKGSFLSLLFIEGIVALCIVGINIGGISESQGTGIGAARVKMTSDPARRDPEARKRLRKEQISSGTHLLIMGAILIGLTALIALLPL